MKILIIQQKMIGDVLTTTILFEALKSKFPEAELHYVVNSHTLPVVEHNPYIDKVQIITPEMEKDKFRFWRFVKTIKKEHYQVIIDVYSKNSSNLITAFSGARTKISQHKSYTSFLYTHTFKNKKAPSTNAGLAIENRMQLLKPLDEVLSSSVFRPKIFLSDKEKNDALILLKDSGIDLKEPLFMISVLGSDPTKSYPVPHMATLIDFIVEQTNGQILFNYIPKQESEAKTVFNFCKKTTKSHIYFNVFGKSLREFFAITSHCTALIGNEGGAINMAKALDIPTFTIFSPWIKKEAWNLFEDGQKHVSIHLKDVMPKLYEEKSMKEIKQEVFSFYEIFPPEPIIKKLKPYLEQFID